MRDGMGLWDLPVTAAELVRLAVGAGEEWTGGYGCAEGDEGCEEGGGVHVGGCESDSSDGVVELVGIVRLLLSLQMFKSSEIGARLQDIYTRSSS